MKPNILFIFAALGLSGCSSVKPALLEKRHLDLSSVEQMHFGKTASDEVIAMIGKPDQIIQLKRDLAGYDAWVYNEEDGVQKFERFGLLIDRKTGIVQSGTWAVRESDSLHQKDTTLSHFKDAKFTERQTGQVARDYTSDDTTFVDQQLGISFQVDGSSQAVSMISFAPSPQRKLAKDQK